MTTFLVQIISSFVVPRTDERVPSHVFDWLDQNILPDYCILSGYLTELIVESEGMLPFEMPCKVTSETFRRSCIFRGMMYTTHACEPLTIWMALTPNTTSW